MAGRTIQKWRFKFWEYRSVTPIKDVLDDLARKSTQGHKAVRGKIRRFLGKSVSQLQQGGILIPHPDDLCEFHVAAGKHKFVAFGVIERGPFEQEFSGLSAYIGTKKADREKALADALARLPIYEQQKSQHYQLYGLQRVRKGL